MNNRISASYEELMKQAKMTAHDYFHAAIETIDERFGKGFSEKNPELIGAFMRTASQDFHTAVTSQSVQDGLADVVEAIQQKS